MPPALPLLRCPYKRTERIWFTQSFDMFDTGESLQEAPRHVFGTKVSLDVECVWRLFIYPGFRSIKASFKDRLSTTLLYKALLLYSNIIWAFVTSEASGGSKPGSQRYFGIHHLGETTILHLTPDWKTDLWSVEVIMNQMERRFGTDLRFWIVPRLSAHYPDEGRKPSLNGKTN